MVCLFNWADDIRRVRLPLHPTEIASDFWTGTVLSRQGGVAFEMRPRTARLLELAHI
jgi:hypothetical protein